VSDEYKKLNLDRVKIKEYVQGYCRISGSELIEFDQSVKKIRVQIKPNEGKVALVDLFLNLDGTTTVQYKLGVNKEEGKNLAQHLKSTINEEEPNNVSFLLNGIDSDSFNLIKHCLEQQQDEGSQCEFEVEIAKSDDAREELKVRSVVHSDRLTITYYKTKNSLHLQGKPLYAYNQTIYLLASELGLNGLISVIYKKDESDEDIYIDYVSIEIKLEHAFPSAYKKLESVNKRLIKTSFALAGLEAKFPDYSVIVFSALRVLESTLRRLFLHLGTEIGNRGFRDKFRRRGESYVVSDEYKATVEIDEKMKTSLESCYSIYHKQRHGLFHVEDLAGATRIVDKKANAESLLDEIMQIINQVHCDVDI
jgi:hypothetical protein